MPMQGRPMMPPMGGGQMPQGMPQRPQGQPMMPPQGGGGQGLLPPMGPMGGNRPQMPAGAFQGGGAPMGGGMPPNAQAGGPVGGMGGIDRAQLAQMLAQRQGMMRGG